MNEQNMIARVNGLHNAYCITTGITLNLTPCFERWWYDAATAGLIPTDLLLVLQDRQRRIKLGERNQACLLLRNICGSEEAIGDVVNEAAQLNALARKPKMNKPKAAVLRATGRETEIKQGDAKPIGDYIKKMRLAVEKGGNNG